MTLALLGLLATVNPAAAALALAEDHRTRRVLPVGAGAVLAAAALVALGAVADPLLDALDVNLGTYRLGAGVVVATVGLRWLVTGAATPVDAPDRDAALAGFVAFPVLFTPGAAALSVSVGAGDGAGTLATAVVVAVGLGGAAIQVRRWLPPSVTTWLVRLLGATAVVVGVIVAVDGVRTL